MNYEPVIGLEVHAELLTKSKMFCGCEVVDSITAKPNRYICPVCTGQPGSLPVLNKKAVELAVRVGLALNCEIHTESIFARKNYFYPDLPKGYQISQYDQPLATNGKIQIETEAGIKEVRIRRVHLEEDTGKSLHMGDGGRIGQADYSLEDFNRAGTPLVEIVSEPDIQSPEQAREFVQELRAILEYLGVSDVRMEEGSLRVDANVSVAPEGERGVKVEIKNMNSVRSVHRALVYEEQRQAKAINGGEKILQETRHWDEKAAVTLGGRAKEGSSDYRYFPEPDLVPVEPSVEWLRQLREEIPQLPSALRVWLKTELSLSDEDAQVLTSSKQMADFFAEAIGAAKTASAKQLSNWLVNDVTRALSEARLELSGSKLAAESFARLIDIVADGEVTARQGKEVLAQMMATGKQPEAVIEESGFEVSGEEEIVRAVDEAIASNAGVAERIKAGDDKPLGVLVGAVMKQTKGRADPKLAEEVLRKLLS